MKQSFVHLLIAMMAIISLVVMACSSGSTAEEDETRGFSEQDSQQIALDYLKKSPTYTFDGIDGSIELIATETLRCRQCWTFVYRLECAQPGYGDRTGQILAQVITPHTARITVQEGNSGGGDCPVR